MRLLNVSTLEFERFGSQIPRYAVASHRWGPNEAAYKDVLKRRNTETQGYRKVEEFCAFVQKWDPSIEWLWIDTCCIDKKSSAEESESINSMYQYYSRAEVCIALLTDVPAMASFEGNDRALMRSFEESVWFTRGWTLQELLAPMTVVFTTSAWEVIGYKTQIDKNGKDAHYGPKFGRFLNGTVAKVTNIPEDVLWDFSLSRQLSVQERMSWMNTRTTTKVEDMAYCLLGIFGVHMALIYGEGEAALFRLEEEIRKRENMSIAGSQYAGDDSRTMAAPSVFGGGAREESPPPMPAPRRAMTFQSASTIPGNRQMRGGASSVINGRSAADNATMRSGAAPRIPERAPPMAPGLSDRVSRWQDQMVEPTPSVVDEESYYEDQDDTETITSWNTAPSEAESNFTAQYGRPTMSPPPIPPIPQSSAHGAFNRGNMQDLSDALPPPYPGPPPPRMNTMSPQDEPTPGINRAQTFTPSTVGSTTSGRPDLKTKRLLRRLAAQEAERGRLDGNRDNQAFSPPARSQTFAGADDLESVAPSDSASSVGGSGSRSGSSQVGPGSLLRRLTEDRERQHSDSGESAPSQGILRSHTGGLLSSLAHERKLLRQQIADSKAAYKQAKKAKRKGEK